MLQRHVALGARCIRSAETPSKTFLPAPPHFPRRSVRQSASHRAVHSQQFQPFVPPSPESLGKARPPKHYPRTAKWGKRLFYISASLGTIYLVDRQFYGSSIVRSTRTFGTGLVVALDYKLNFREHPLFGGTIADLHRRSAEKLFRLLRENGGLYLKIGFVLYTTSPDRSQG